MIILRIRPLTNDHLEEPASRKWSSGGSGHLQMIIWRDRPFANDHPEDPASCKWSFGGTSLLQMIICHSCHPSHLCQDPDSILRTFLELFLLVGGVSVTKKIQLLANHHLCIVRSKLTNSVCWKLGLNPDMGQLRREDAWTPSQRWASMFDHFDIRLECSLHWLW